ncbi:hypothetical protein MHYP_G00017820 [Metynnis hypsauchen]
MCTDLSLIANQRRRRTARPSATELPPEPLRRTAKAPGDQTSPCSEHRYAKLLLLYLHATFNPPLQSTELNRDACRGRVLLLDTEGTLQGSPPDRYGTGTVTDIRRVSDRKHFTETELPSLVYAKTRPGHFTLVNIVHLTTAAAADRGQAGGPWSVPGVIYRHAAALSGALTLTCTQKTRSTAISLNRSLQFRLRLNLELRNGALELDLLGHSCFKDERMGKPDVLGGDGRLLDVSVVSRDAAVRKSDRTTLWTRYRGRGAVTD